MEKKNVAKFVYACLTYLKSKLDQYKPSSWMQPLCILELKWDNIYKDFFGGLFRIPKGYNTICVTLDRMTKLAHFIRMNIMYSKEKLVDLYISEIETPNSFPCF